MGSTHYGILKNLWDNVPGIGWWLVFFVSFIIYSNVVDGLWRNDKTRTAGYWLKGIFWSFWGLLLLWKLGLFGNFHFNSSIDDNQTQGVAFIWNSWSWVKLALSAIALGLALLCLRIALKASFFRDWRLTASKDKPYWQGAYWPCVIFVLGFFPSLIWMIWSPTWYLVPMMWVFWRIGSWPVGRKAIERWVQQFNEHLFPNGDSKERFGKCYFFGKEAPQPDSFQLLFGVPFCLPLSSVTVQPWEIVDDSKPTGLIPTKDGSMVNVSVRVRMLTCDHPSVVMELSGGEVSSTIDGSFGIVMNDVPDLVSTLGQKTLRSEIDAKFTEPSLDLPRKDPRVPEVGKESKNDRIRRKVLLEKGNRILSIDFGAPIPAPAIAAAMENAAAALLNQDTAKTNANTAAEVLKIETTAKVAAQQKLFMAEAIGVIDEAQKRGEKITLQQALVLVIQRHQADATRTVIDRGVGMTANINPQQP